eukprot:1146952-Pelagomonas_calceolata.AAC.6
MRAISSSCSTTNDALVHHTLNVGSGEVQHMVQAPAVHLGNNGNTNINNNDIDVNVNGCASWLCKRLRLAHGGGQREKGSLICFIAKHEAAESGEGCPLPPPQEN